MPLSFAKQKKLPLQLREECDIHMEGQGLFYLSSEWPGVGGVEFFGFSIMFYSIKLRLLCRGIPKCSKTHCKWANQMVPSQSIF